MNKSAASTDVLDPVRYAVTVPLPADRAFRLFTEGYNTWWPGHHIGTADMAEAVLEPRTGGRYYERGVDGSECEWGRVLACEPPHRIVVAWQITESDGAWVYDPDLSHASEFEATFREQPDGQTRVELEHRHIERHGAGAAGIHRGVGGPGGWPGIMENYAKVAAAA
ncbi:MAG: SRPBCC family protein [Streptosporangiaceae bacterium]